MTIMEYLKNCKYNIDMNKPIQLNDVVDDGIVYCKGYDDLINLLDSKGMEHIKNARYVIQQQTGIFNLILYIKNIEYYSDFELEQLAEKLS